AGGARVSPSGPAPLSRPAAMSAERRDARPASNGRHGASPAAQDMSAMFIGGRGQGRGLTPRSLDAGVPALPSPEGAASPLGHPHLVAGQPALHLRLLQPPIDSSTDERNGAPSGPEHGGTAMIRSIVVAVLMALAASTARAATPFGSDDAGFIPPDAPKGPIA